MLFSSLVFLYVFLPLTLFLVVWVENKWRNYILLFLSLVFYAWGGVSYSLVMIASIVLNYFMGIWVSKVKDKGNTAKRVLGLTVVLNLLGLVIFKYTGFIGENLNLLLDGMGLEKIQVPDIKLPIGISFFTFHALSYVVDIYRGKAEVQKNFGKLALYISLFPQLVAGPIIRYHDVADQLTNRVMDSAKFASGVRRFVVGLGKKVLLSNMFAFPADEIFALRPYEMDFGVAWFGALCYSLHIYCDFSGYSDMAIGLGRMFGFEFLENFNFPYIAKSIQDFWRRWHISLSNFFRDYVYIPLGGNRGTEFQTYRNLLLVFFLTGLWHGASWTFIFWGMFHGLFLVVERVGFSKILEKVPVFAHCYTLLVVVIAWVFFRAESFSQAGNFLLNMLGMGNWNQNTDLITMFMHRGFILALVIALLGSTGFLEKMARYLQSNSEKSLSYSVIYSGMAVVSIILIIGFSTLFLISDTYNPFIYFRF
jgi:alginate O-acetyltransferase complex protein AlgI